jgi:predicted RNase H-like HicB family nuclease
MDNYEVVLEQDVEGGYVALIPRLPGCVTQGDTKKEALENAKDAIKLMLDVLGDDGISLEEYSGINKVEWTVVTV